MPRRLKIQKETELDFELGRMGGPMLDDLEEPEYKEPDTWTIITALNRVLDQARASELSDKFWASVKNPLAYLRGELGITDIQIVVMAMLIEAGEPLSWKKMGNFLHCSRLQMMTYTEEIEEMVKKRWFVRSCSREFGRTHRAAVRRQTRESRRQGNERPPSPLQRRRRVDAAPL